MKIPWSVYAGGIAQALPLVAVVVRRSGLTRTQRWTVAWAGFLLGFDAIALTMALSGRNNHLLNYALTPLVTSFALFILSLWQLSSRSTRAIRYLIPLLVIVWVVMVATIESTRTFSLVAEPFAGLLLLGAAVWTLLTRAIREEGRLGRQEWSWIVGGMALYAATSVALPPVSYLLVDLSPQLVNRAFEGKSLIDVVAFALIARGVLVAPSSHG